MYKARPDLVFTVTNISFLQLLQPVKIEDITDFENVGIGRFVGLFQNINETIYFF